MKIDFVGNLPLNKTVGLHRNDWFIDGKLYTECTVNNDVSGKIDRQLFDYTVNTLNNLYAEAEKANCSTYCEGEGFNTSVIPHLFYADPGPVCFPILRNSYYW